MNGKKNLIFLVLSFGLKSAPYIFTKITRPLVKKWIGEGKCIVMYLDDGIGFGQDFESARSISESVRADLRSSGFVINASKSLWNPIQSLGWLGYSIDTVVCFDNTCEEVEESWGTGKEIISVVIKHKTVPVRNVATFVG